MLDPYQQRAVEAPERRVCCIAGAGSGKTRVLTARVRWLNEVRHIPYSRIAAITFSKKAGGELEDRILVDAGLVGATGMQIGTFHSLGFKVIRSVNPTRGVADVGLTRRLIRRAISETKCREEFAQVVRAIVQTKRAMGNIPSKFRTVFYRYEALLEAGRVWDFDDLLGEAVRLLESSEKAQRLWQDKFEEILVDEVQDTSAVQWRLVTALLGQDTGLYLVGDRGQSIYGWRGAETSVLDTVERELGPFAHYELPTNYRSRPQVVTLANLVLGKQPGSVVLLAAREGTDASVIAQLPVPGSSWEEAKNVGRALRQAKTVGLIEDWGDAAVLVRVNAATEAFESYFGEVGIPAVVMGGTGFYARSEVQDVLAYLRLVTAWDEQALGRIYNRPARYIGAVFLDELAKQGGWATAVAGNARFERRGYQQGLDRLLGDVTRVRAAAIRGGASEAVRTVLQTIGYQRWCLGEQIENDADEALAEMFDALQRASERWESVPDFLAFADLSAKRAKGQPTGRVVISTVHKAKGLEWPLVVVGAINDGVLPHKHAEDQEEERRIFYVAITRARDVLMLSASGSPSEFFLECAEHIGPARALVAEVGDGDAEAGNGVAGGREDRPALGGQHDPGDDPAVRGGGSHGNGTRAGLPPDGE